MKTLQDKAARQRLAAWRPRTSRLGLAYMLSITVSFAVLFRMVSVFFIVIHTCGPMWDLWLKGWHQGTSLFQSLMAMSVALTVLLVMDMAVWMKTIRPRKISTMIAYLALLAMPVSAMVVFFLFYGAMIPTSVAGPIYEAVSQWVTRYYGYYTPYEELPEGPLGTCPPVPSYSNWSGPTPKEIGAL